MQNLESFYNYRTIDEDYKLVSSVLSNENNLIELKVVKIGISARKIYEVVPEITPENLEDSEYNNLRLKKERIKSALHKIQMNSHVDNNNNNINNETTTTRTTTNNNNNNDFFNYFSLPQNIDMNSINEPRERPEYCRPYPGTAKKPPCCNCRETCSFSMESLVHPVYSIGQNDILDELEIHHHPRSRIITDQTGHKHQRITIESARELAKHYVFVHNKKWPEII